MKKAMIVMDYMNELVHPDGKFNARGYPAFEQQHNVLNTVQSAVAVARTLGYLIVYVKFGFSKDYSDLPKHSPLFALAEKYQAVQLGTWATEFHEILDMQTTDKIITKNRISPFYGTDLDAYLRNNEVTELFLCGVSTDLVVQSAARDAHDMDYAVTILADCCVAGNMSDHESSLETLAKIASVGNSKDLLQI